MPAPQDQDSAEAEKKSDAESKQLELVEQNAKLAEKLEATAAQVASIAQHVAERPAAAPAAQPQAPVQPLSEEQVMALVEEKRITLAQGMTYLRRRAAEEARAEAQQATAAALVAVGNHADHAQTVADINQYKAAIPGLGRRGSPEWNEVAERYAKLIAKNYPQTLKTELQALREIYGDEPEKSRERAEPRERTKERATRGAETPSSSASRGPGPRRTRGDSAESDLPADHKTYVEHMIRIGQYKGWDDPKVSKYAERVRHKARA